MTLIRQWTLRYDTKNKTSKRQKNLEYLDFNRTNFCASKDTIKRIKRQFTEREKFGKSHMW